MKNIFMILFALSTISCEPKKSVNSIPLNKEGLEISKSLHGVSPKGEVQLYTIKNGNGMVMEVSEYGGIITKIIVPDKNGIYDDVVLGFDNLEGYLSNHPYFGALIGRYGNRIANAKFSINGHQYDLAANNGVNSLHGGIEGFDKKIWKSKIIETPTAKGVELSGISTDMEEGFPGNLEIKVRYLLNNNNEIHLEYEAITDKSTVVNLTNHSYFNLKGAGKGDILDHKLMIAADMFTVVNDTSIPLGNLASVLNTPFDFLKPSAIGDRIDKIENEQIKFGNGYDHNYVLTDESDGLKLAATVYEESTGRFMEVYTTEPGIQFYTGNYLNGTILGKGDKQYHRRYALCLETQHFPDSPNQPNFPSTLLEPGVKYETKTIYKFSIK